jgi:hypothetical protein
LQGERYEEDFVVKACGRVIDCSLGLFTPSTLGAKASSLAYPLMASPAVTVILSRVVVFAQKGSADRFWNNLPPYL